MSLENVLARFVALSLGGSTCALTMVVMVSVLAIAVSALFVARTAVQYLRALWINQVLLAASLLAICPSLDTPPSWPHRIRLLFQHETIEFREYQVACFLALLVVAALPLAFLGAAVPPILVACVMISGQLATSGQEPHPPS